MSQTTDPNDSSGTRAASNVAYERLAPLREALSPTADLNPTTIKPIEVWAAVNPEGRFTFTCVYKEEEEARADRRFWLEECGWRLVPMQIGPRKEEINDAG